MDLSASRLTRLRTFDKYRHVLRRIGHLLVVSALLAGIGGHWAILQTVAWATMLADNLRQSSLTEAVSNTFDGEHPCPMCTAIKQGRADEKQQDQQQVKPGFKLELGVLSQGDIFTLTQAREWVSSANLFADSHDIGPPKPRPRRSSSLVIS